MNRWAFVLIGIFVLGSTSFAQKRGSQEMGGGVSFWSLTEKDSSETNFNLNGLWALYFSRDFMFEFEPIVTMRFSDDDFDLSGLVMGGLSKRIIDVSNIDRGSSNSWGRKHEQTIAGIYGSVAGGLWAQRSDDPNDDNTYIGPAFGVALGTHSTLGSLTKVRTKFQYVYLMPTLPMFDVPRSMFTITIGFSVITKL